MSWCFSMMKKPVHHVDYTISPFCILKTGFLSKYTSCNIALLQNSFLFVCWNFSLKIRFCSLEDITTKAEFWKVLSVFCRCSTVFMLFFWWSHMHSCLQLGMWIHYVYPCFWQVQDGLWTNKYLHYFFSVWLGGFQALVLFKSNFWVFF